MDKTKGPGHLSFLPDGSVLHVFSDWPKVPMVTTDFDVKKFDCVTILVSEPDGDALHSGRLASIQGTGIELRDFDLTSRPEFYAYEHIKGLDVIM